MTLQRVIELVATELGHRLDDEVAGRYRRALELLARNSGLTLAQLTQSLTPTSPSWRTALESVLVHETYFFRDPAQFGLVAHLAEAARQRGQRFTSGLSIGCSSGEEAYSLAATLLDSSTVVSVVGIDFSASALSVAREGQYDARSFRELPAEVLGPKVEALANGRVQVGPQLRAAVQFELMNLSTPLHLEHLRTRRADVVFCRNVLMYLTAAQAEQVRAALFEVVAPQGCLVVGPLDVEGAPPGFIEARRTGAPVTELEKRLLAFGTASSVFIRAPSLSTTAIATPVPPHRPVNELLAEARTLADRGAHRDATKLLEGRDHTPEVQLLLGTMLVEQGHLARAEFCFRRVLLQLPESIEASFRLLMVLSQTTDEPMQRQLAAVLERAIEGHADDLELAPGITPSMIRQVLKKVASTTL